MLRINETEVFLTWNTKFPKQRFQKTWIMHRLFKLGYLFFQHFFKFCEFFFGGWTHGINAGDTANTWGERKKKKKNVFRCLLRTKSYIKKKFFIGATNVFNCKNSVEQNPFFLTSWKERNEEANSFLPKASFANSKSASSCSFFTLNFSASCSSGVSSSCS